MSCRKQCAVGSGGKSVGYLAHGTATDYMYDVLNVPLPFTWEIFGDTAAAYDDCFRMFNPLGRQQVAQVVEQWVTATFMLLEMMPQHPAVGPLDPALFEPPGDQQPEPQGGLGLEERGGHDAQGGVLPGQGRGPGGGARATAAQMQASHAMAALRSFEVVVL